MKTLRDDTISVFPESLPGTPDSYLGLSPYLRAFCVFVAMNSSSLANWNGSQADAKQRKPVPSQSSFLASWTVAAVSNITARDGRGFNAARATEDQARVLKTLTSPVTDSCS